MQLQTRCCGASSCTCVLAGTNHAHTRCLAAGSSPGGSAAWLPERLHARRRKRHASPEPGRAATARSLASLDTVYPGAGCTRQVQPRGAPCHRQAAPVRCSEKGASEEGMWKYSRETLCRSRFAVGRAEQLHSKQTAEEKRCTYILQRSPSQRRACCRARAHSRPCWLQVVVWLQARDCSSRSRNAPSPIDERERDR